MQTIKNLIVVMVMMVTYFLPMFANTDGSELPTGVWSVNAYQNEESFVDNGQDNPMEELDVLMTNEVDPDNGGDGPPPDPLPIDGGIGILLWGVVGYLVYKLKRKHPF